MPNALLTGVSGLLAHQRRLDVVGHNIANMNTAGYKSQRALFADLFYQTIRPATSASEAAGGGTNPNQIGGGVKAGAIDRRFGQGNLELTGGLFDFAIEGDGFFTLNDGTRNVYTRTGTFSLDNQGTLVDSVTGNRVMRFGNVGEGDGTNPAFQTPGDASIRIPLGTTIPGRATSEVALAGNLAAKSLTQTLVTTAAPLLAGDFPAEASTEISNLDGSIPAFAIGGQIEISGTDANGAAIGPITFDVNAGSTVGQLLGTIDSAFDHATAEIDDYGNLFLRANSPGPAPDLSLTLSDLSTTDVIRELQTTVQGEMRNEFPGVVEVFDEQGGAHTLTLLFEKQEDNLWNMNAQLKNSADGHVVDGRVDGITFNEDGTFDQIGTTGLGVAEIELQFAGFSSPQRISLDFGGSTAGEGLSQYDTKFSLKNQQDGYGVGALNSISVSADGRVFGVASNGSIFPVAQLAIASFQNRKGLSAIGNNAYEESLNSGQAQIGGFQGSVRAGQLEASNVDIAYEFTQLIVAQRGFSANARTITVSDEVLEELTNIIR